MTDMSNMHTPSTTPSAEERASTRAYFHSRSHELAQVLWAMNLYQGAQAGEEELYALRTPDGLLLSDHMVLVFVARALFPMLPFEPSLPEEEGTLYKLAARGPDLAGAEEHPEEVWWHPAPRNHFEDILASLLSRPASPVRRTSYIYDQGGALMRIFTRPRTCDTHPGLDPLVLLIQERYLDLLPEDCTYTSHPKDAGKYEANDAPLLVHDKSGRFQAAIMPVMAPDQCLWAWRGALPLAGFTSNDEDNGRATMTGRK